MEFNSLWVIGVGLIGGAWMISRAIEDASAKKLATLLEIDRRQRNAFFEALARKDAPAAWTKEYKAFAAAGLLEGMDLDEENKP